MLDIDAVAHRFEMFRSLMAFRIQEILLVSSVYDAYMLEEDGTLEEQLWQQYADRGLSMVPRIRKVASPERALQVIGNERIDLVLAVVHDRTEMLFDLTGRIKAVRPELPIAVLATDPAALPRLTDTPRTQGADRIFLWQNDPTLLIAIIKYFEDLANVSNDTRVGGVRVVMLVEDSVVHYSRILPAIYTAIMTLTRQLIDEGLNHLHRQLRMRSRAKIVLADCFEEALETYRRYRPYILGVVSDVRFKKQGRLDNEAGFALVDMLRREMPELPICIQSAEPELNRPKAEREKAFFVDKNSNRLMEDLQRFLQETMGFGDFIFRLRDGREVARAGNPRELLNCLSRVPGESILHHAAQQHFSHWMMARTEIKIAEQLYPKRVEDFREVEALRRFLIRVIGEVLHEKQSDVITRFIAGRNPQEMQFMRWGEGSLGGKARGIGFLRYLLSRLEMGRQFPEMVFRFTPTIVICSSEFALFLEGNGLWDDALGGVIPFGELQARFMAGAVRVELVHVLRAYLDAMRDPLAVRSSSILEDSHHLPLAGLYATIMLPNSEATPDERLASLLSALKLIWASVFGDDPRAYFRQTQYRIEDERMAVVVQAIGGCRRGGYFYPTLSGVAQSRNFYPVSHMKPEDGVVQVALGLGKTVVEGGPVVRFCPRYPMLLPQFADLRGCLNASQKQFYALNLTPLQGERSPAGLKRLESLPLSMAETHGVLQKVASVYQSDSGLLADSFFYDGPRVVTFQKVLRDPRLRFGELLSTLLSICERAMRMAVEIEFACELPDDGPPVFYPLQLRPLASLPRWQAVDVPDSLKERAFCYSHLAHGNGRYDGIHDVVFVKPEAFDKGKTREIAREIGGLNKMLRDAGRPYVLVGFGRWGSSDPWMGIGVGWAQISGVKVLVEVGLKGFNVDPAQGTHFFQNVTALNIGCLSIPHRSRAFIKWEVLEAGNPVMHTAFLSWMTWPEALDIRIDGRNGEAAIGLSAGSVL